MRRRRGGAAALSVLNVAAAGSTPLACGTCAWIPFQATIPHVPTAGPFQYQFVPIPANPNLIGGRVDFQWTSVTPSASPCSWIAAVSMPNAVRVTIGGS